MRTNKKITKQNEQEVLERQVREAVSELETRYQDVGKTD